MQITNIADDVFQLSVNVKDILFEGLWEIPTGVALNSYIVKGEKTAIIDGVCGWDGVPESLFALLDKLEINPESIEYLVVNHMEPDHSGWIEDFKKINANFKVVCSKKGKELFNAFYGENENEIQVVKDGDTLDLGNGHVLAFAEIPNVHWPDTIATFDTSNGILFPCDAFGAFGALEGIKYGEELTEEGMKQFDKDAVRYYSNIVAAFSLQVKKAIQKCGTLDIKLIAPGHGLMWKNPQTIIDLYSDYANYQKGPAREEITLIWGSMYGMTEKAAMHVVEVLKKEGIAFNVHRVPEDTWGDVLTSAWTSTGLIIGMPTYEFKMFPPMAAVLEEIGKKKVHNRKVLRFGSYGWSGGAQKELDEITTRLKVDWEFVEPVEFLGNPKEEDLELLETRVKELVQLVRETCKK